MWVMGWVIVLSLLSANIADWDVSTAKAVQVKPSSVLVVDISGGIQEHSARALPSVMQEALGQEVGLSLPDLLDVLKRAANDPNIQGISLKIGRLSGSLAQLEDIRQALLACKEEGKFIYAYAHNIGQGEYYIASVADVLALNPIGGLQFNGIVAKRMYIKRALDKLKIKPVVFRVGMYKSAVEPLTRSSMSAESRTQMTEMLETIYGTYLHDIGEARQTAPETLRAWADEYGLWTPEMAKEKNLITHIGYPDLYEGLLREKLNIDEGEKIPSVHWHDYAASTRQKRSSKNKVAVLVAQGSIRAGEGSFGEGEGIFADDLVHRIKRLKKDSSVQAVVLRIHSPGGSFAASDKIWKALQELAKEKPLVASMAGVAASGGYYIALPCHRVFARPTTITGSIGVFGLFFNVGEGARSIGLDFDKVQTGPMADLIDVAEPLSPAVRAVMTREIDRIYGTFLNKVAVARAQSVEDIHRVAQGRVWTGSAAKEHNLIDEHGGLYAAAQWAAQQANIPEDDYVLHYESEIPWDKMLRQIIFSAISLDFVHGLQAITDPYEELLDLQGIQARCLERIRF